MLPKVRVQVKTKSCVNKNAKFLIFVSRPLLIAKTCQFQSVRMKSDTKKQGRNLLFGIESLDIDDDSCE